jgi:hypothetical protein
MGEVSKKCSYSNAKMGNPGMGPNAGGDSIRPRHDAHQFIRVFTGSEALFARLLGRLACLRSQIPSRQPRDSNRLQAEVLTQPLIHIDQMAGAVENPNVLFAGRQLLLEDF